MKEIILGAYFVGVVATFASSIKAVIKNGMPSLDICIILVCVPFAPVLNLLIPYHDFIKKDLY